MRITLSVRVLLSIASQLGLMPYQVYMLLMGKLLVPFFQCPLLFPLLAVPFTCMSE